MGYYRGDYYTGYRSGGVARGDYYRSRAQGDPGFLGFLGAIGRGIVGFGKAALGIPTAAKTAAATAAVEALPAAMPETGMIPVATRAAGQIAKAVPGVVAKAGRVLKSPIGGTIAGTVVGGWILDAAGNVIGRAPRRRHMNVCNQKALRRSMRRVHGFAKVARRTISFTQRVRMKKRGRRRAA